jgi:hypothetical protein
VQILTKAILAALLAVLLGVTVYLAWPAGPPPETKDRLSPEAIEQMVEGPMVAVRKEGLPSGVAVFERQLTLDRAQYGSGSVRVADLLTAFGVELYTEGAATENEAEMRAARDYLRNAIPVYRKAFGQGSPEVAVALHTFADADIAIHDNRLTPEAEAALVEALRIRRAALGPDNRETRATEARLARARARKDAPRWPANSADRALEEAEDALPE